MTQICKCNKKAKISSKCCAGIENLLSPKFFRALCDPNRISMLARLAECCEPVTVGEIAKCLPINVSVVSRHLSTLRDTGILTAEKKGKEVFYSVNYSNLVNLLRSMADAIEACCPPGERKEAKNEKRK